nr:MAG TPA: hypothetical protein [Caudoviricetes sp.]
MTLSDLSFYLGVLLGYHQDVGFPYGCLLELCI